MPKNGAKSKCYALWGLCFCVRWSAFTQKNDPPKHLPAAIHVDFKLFDANKVVFWGRPG